MKLTRKGESHLLSKKVGESFMAYGESVGWTMQMTPDGLLFRVLRTKESE